MLIAGGKGYICLYIHRFEFPEDYTLLPVFSSAWIEDWSAAEPLPFSCQEAILLLFVAAI